MAFDTVNERISALNISTFGLMAGLFIPLQASGAITTDDAENALGWYIGVSVAVTAPEVEDFTHFKTPGAMGVYDSRVIWRRLGSSYDRVYEFTFTDPVKWVITNAFIEVDPVGTGNLYGKAGAQGQYSKKQIWNRLGLSRDRVYEISCTDPVKVVITNAFIEVE